MSRKFLHLADVNPRVPFMRELERQRHIRANWFIEMFGEWLGVFMFVYAGVNAHVAYRLGEIAGKPGQGSLFSVAVQYGFAITFAITTCASVSGGHFNPAVTITSAIFKGFPPAKAARYVFAQVFGGYVATLIVYTQYYDYIKVAENALVTAGTYDTVNFSQSGLAGIFTLYAGVSHIGRIFLTEFVADFFIAMIIWSCLDPTNFFVPPAALPWVIGFGYTVIIQGCAPIGLAANAALDVGGRFAAISIWGTQASGGTYAFLTGLTSIPATMLALFVYEFIFMDSSRVIVPSHRELIEGHQAHTEHREDGSRYEVDLPFHSDEENDRKSELRG